MTRRHHLVVACDVGPESEHPKLERDGFGGLSALTSFGKLVGRQVPERAVRSALIVVDAPGFDRRLRVLIDVN